MFSDTSSDDPYSAIKDKFGTQEFTVTFNSENLSEPIDDITYTAYNMPTLPTPKRVGYVFDGWYFDAMYTTPYYENVLYLYMCDVTLYAKWAKEELVQDGVYDISVSLEVVEGSISKNSLADKYGNSPEYFLSDVDTEAFQIEKVGEQILFKFPYTVHTSESFGGTLEMYNVSVNTSLMGSTVSLEEQIAALAETDRTLYFDITDIELEDTMYFSVSAYKWDAAVEEDENIDNTRISFTLAVTITEFYGLTSYFADPDIKLEDGVYSVKTYYESDMMSSFNSVFSYIYAEDGHYTLVKPFMPYTGYVGTGFNLEYYYNIYTVIVPIQYYYGVSENGTVSEYKAIEIEYHADTGRYYYVFDLGSELKQDLVFSYVVGGPMQVLYKMGIREMTLTIEYGAMVKIDSAEYEPLAGDCYVYEDTFAGADSELVESEYDVLTAYGTYVSYINFFYSAADSEDTARTMYSHKIAIAPTNSADLATDVAIAAFSRNVRIYGYNVSSGGELFANLFTATTMTDKDIAMWGNERIRSGVSLETGDTVDLEELFYEKVAHDGNFADAEITAYRMNGDSVDYSSEYDLNGATVFSFTGQNIAVVYTFNEYDEDGNITGINTAVVELRSYSVPTLRFRGGFSYDEEQTEYVENGVHFYSSQTYDYGDTVDYPNLYYSWYSEEDNFIGLYSGEDDQEIHPIYVNTYYMEGNEYFVADIKVSWERTKFIMQYDNIVVVYELHNYYGEKYYVHVHFATGAQEEYAILRNGEIITTGRVTYTNGVVDSVDYTETYGNILYTYSDLQEMLQDRYVFSVGESETDMSLQSADVYTQPTVATLTEDIGAGILSMLKDADYALIVITYSDGTNSYTIRYGYKMYFEGSSSYIAISYDTIFTGVNYTLELPTITSESGLSLTTGGLGVIYSGSDDSAYTSTSNGSYYTVQFHRAGQYTITCLLPFTYASDGGRVFNRDGDRYYYNGYGYLRVQLHTIIVEDAQGTVTVTYVTDEEHPFADGSLERTETYSLANIIYLLSGDSFMTSEAGHTLYGWTTNPNYNITDDSKISSPGFISDFIGTFNSNDVTLYAVWDEKVTVTLSAVSIDGGETTVYFEDIYSATYSASEGQWTVRIFTFLTYAQNRVPSGYVLLGFTGGFFGDEIYTSYGNWHSQSSRAIYKPGNYEIYAVYAKAHTVSYDTGYRTYTGTYYGNESVVEGETVGEEKTVTPYEGYVFAGWCVQTAEENYTAEDIVNLTEYVITEDVTFVALYYDEEGNLVW